MARKLVDIDLELYRAQEELNEKIKDPFDFAFLLFDFVLYPWQNDFLRDSGRKIVLRCGRQCITPDTDIITRFCERQKLIDIAPKDTIWSKSKNNNIEKDKVKDQWKSGVRKVYLIRTQGGKELKCSSQHPIYSKMKLDIPNHSKYSPNNWNSIDGGIKEGDLLAIPDKFGEFGTVSDPDGAKLLGYMVSDGSSRPGHSIKFTNTNPYYIDEVKNILKIMDSPFKDYTDATGCVDISITDGKNGKIGSKAISFIKKHYDNVRVPKIIYTYDKESTALFINRLFAGDGWFSIGTSKSNNTYAEIGLVSQSYEFLKDIEAILWKFGIHSYINEMKGMKLQKQRLWKLRLTRITDIERFKRGISIFRKNKKLPVRKSTTIIEGQIRYDKIVSITYLGKKTTRDLETVKNHNFIANGIIVHNTGKTTICAIRAIFDCYHNSNYLILCLSPSLRQSGILFDKCRDFIGQSKFIKSKVVRETRTLIEFANGSKILSLPTGIDGTSARGYSANCIICDESQAINNKVFTAIEPILSTTGGQLILLGTPNRKSGKFYDASTKSNNGWKKYHVTYKANPLITEAFILAQKTDMTTEAFAQEYLAEFCDDDSAFFPAELFYGGGIYGVGCIAPYIVLNEKNINVDYFCGVDFAKRHDKTCIIILEREKPNPNNNWAPACKIAHFELLEKKDYVKQVAHITALSKKYSFKAFYIDTTGLGAVMYDMLVTQIKKVKSFSFNQATKPKVYGNLKVGFEKLSILLPGGSKGDANKGLVGYVDLKEIISQFTNIHEETTAAGRTKLYPANKSIHDDIVDALALAYHGVTQKKGVGGLLKGVLR